MKIRTSVVVMQIAMAFAAAAAEEPTVMAVGGSFAPYVRTGQWGEVAAKLNNPTGRPVRVRFVYPTEDADLGRMRYTRTVWMPPYTERTIRLGRRSGTATDPQRMHKGNFEQGFRLENALTGTMLSRDYMLVVPLSDDKAAVAYVDTEDTMGKNLSYLAEIPGNPFGKVALGKSVQYKLPDRWYGYSVLDLFVISATEPSELLDNQIEAVLDWVKQGGTLLVTSHAKAEQTISGRLAEACGVAVVGTHEEYRLEATETGHAYRQAGGKSGRESFAVDLRVPSVMMQLCPSDADVLWEANGLPLLTRRRMGAGYVFTMAVPIGALDGRQAVPVWETMASQMRWSFPISGEAFAVASREKLGEIAGRRGPGRIVPVFIIGVQMVLFVLVGMILRRRRRGELAWLVLIPAGLLCAAGLLFYGSTIREASRVSFLALADSQQDGTAHVRQVSAYYTPKTENIAFSSGSAIGIVSPVGKAFAAAMESTEVVSGRTMRIEDVRAVGNSSRTAYAETPVNLPGPVTAEIYLGPEGLQGKITNQTGSDLFDAVILAGGKAYAVGDLPGGSATAISANDPPLPKGTYIGGKVRVGTDLLRDEILAAIAYRPAPGRRFLPDPVLLAWSRERFLDPLAGGTDAESRGFTLLSLPVRLRKSPPGAKVVVPSGLLRLEIDSVGSPVFNPVTREFIRSSRLGGVSLSFSPPAGATDLVDARATLRITLRATGCRMEILGAGKDDASGETLLKTVDRPVGTYEIAVEGLDRFIGGEEGQYRLIVKIEPIEKDKSRVSERSSFWKIDSLNLTLEGTNK